MRYRTRILMDAKELIADESLWAQGSMETMDDPPRRCLSGAICAATGVDEIEIEDNPIKRPGQTAIDDAIALVKSVIQKRYDGERKLRAFMKLEDIEHYYQSQTSPTVRSLHV